MHAGDGDACAQAHKFRQHFSPGDNGNAVSHGFDNFWVTVFNGGRFDEHMGFRRDITFVMTNFDIGAKVAQTLDNRGISEV